MNSVYGPSKNPSLRDPQQGHDDSALLLLESLIHGLIAAKAIKRSEAIEIVNVAIDVKLETAHQRGDDPLAAVHAARHLAAIEQTLKLDEPFTG